MPDPPCRSWKEETVSIGMTPCGTIGRLGDQISFFFLILPWSLLVSKGFRHARFTATISVKSEEKLRFALSKVN